MSRRDRTVQMLTLLRFIGLGKGRIDGATPP
jgi:hypothetical protein